MPPQQQPDISPSAYDAEAPAQDDIITRARNLADGYNPFRHPVPHLFRIAAAFSLLGMLPKGGRLWDVPKTGVNLKSSMFLGFRSLMFGTKTGPGGALYGAIAGGLIGGDIASAGAGLFVGSMLKKTPEGYGGLTKLLKMTGMEKQAKALDAGTLFSPAMKWGSTSHVKQIASITGLKESHIASAFANAPISSSSGKISTRQFYEKFARGAFMPQVPTRISSNTVDQLLKERERIVGKAPLTGEAGEFIRQVKQPRNAAEQKLRKHFWKSGKLTAAETSMLGGGIVEQTFGNRISVMSKYLNRYGIASAALGGIGKGVSALGRRGLIWKGVAEQVRQEIVGAHTGRAALEGTEAYIRSQLESSRLGKRVERFNKVLGGSGESRGPGGRFRRGIMSEEIRNTDEKTLRKQLKEVQRTQKLAKGKTKKEIQSIVQAAEEKNPLLREAMSSAKFGSEKGLATFATVRNRAMLSAISKFAVGYWLLAKPAFGGAIGAVKSGLEMLEKGAGLARSIGRMEFGSGRALVTEQASTERGRAIQAIQNSGINARQYLGREALMYSE